MRFGFGSGFKSSAWISAAGVSENIAPSLWNPKNCLAILFFWQPYFGFHLAKDHIKINENNS
jgi:hypothetical protein